MLRTGHIESYSFLQCQIVGDAMRRFLHNLVPAFSVCVFLMAGCGGAPDPPAASTSATGDVQDGERASVSNVPTFDATTEESAEHSLDEMKNALPTAQKEDFVNAVGIVSLSAMDIGESFSGDEEAIKAEISRNLMEILDGKTADEIIVMSDEILARRSQDK